MTGVPARICGLGTAVPRHVVTQERARAMARTIFGSQCRDVDRLLTVFDHCGVERRRFCVPPDWFAEPHSFRDRNDRYRDEVLSLAAESVRRALADVMGFEFSADGMRVVLDRGVPAIVRSHLAESVKEVCRRAEVRVDEIDHFLLHPGGAKVLDAFVDALPVDRPGLERSWGVLRDHGNMSAPTALFVLRRAFDGRSAPDRRRAGGPCSSAR